MHLVAPQFSTDTLTPTFQWEAIGTTLAESTIYVSTHPAGRGLFPSDFGDDQDGNRNRIVSGINVGLELDYQLPDNRRLTAGQTYYWGVEGIDVNGRLCRVSGQFTTDPIDIGQGSSGFNGVTVVVHGYVPPIPPWYDDELITQFDDLAQLAVDASGGGVVLRYDRDTGGWWVPPGTSGPNAPKLGESLALVFDWIEESDIDDSGFSEAAGDALFAAIMQLDQQYDGAILRAPLHFIAHSRGTIVTSETLQRLGTYVPSKNDIHLTTLDVHDEPQTNLAMGVNIAVNSTTAKLVTLAHWDDFHEPRVHRWSNVKFADNYYQDEGALNLGIGVVPFLSTNQYGMSLTPNGRSLDGEADVEIHLDETSGFMEDDAAQALNGVLNGAWNLLQTKAGTGTVTVSHKYLSKLPAISKIIKSVPIPWVRALGYFADAYSYYQAMKSIAKGGQSIDGGSLGVGPHSRVWRWYAGTADLAIDDFPLDSEPLLRQLHDIEKFDGFGGIRAGVPWYVSQTPTFDPVIYPAGVGHPELWEGIGVGWFYSDLGGGKDLRTSNGKANAKDAFALDNTHSAEYPVQASDVVVSGAKVASIYNGNFEAGTMRRDNRFALSSPDRHDAIPGWSFHGGLSGTGTPGAFAVVEGTGRIVDLRDDPDVPVADKVKYKHVLELSPERKSNVVRHNRMFIPDNATEVAFDLRIVNASPDDVFTIYLDASGLGGSLELLSAGVNPISIVEAKSTFQKVRLVLPNASPGQNRGIGTLTFQLDKRGSTAEARLWIDNVTFVDRAVNGLPLTADDASESATDSALASAQIRDPLLAATQQWTSLALTGSEAQPLSGVSAQVDALSNDMLAMTLGSTVLLDDNAAGHSWFIDATPWDNEEFVLSASGNELVAAEGSPAFGKIDLLTVLMHEMGHVLGLGHDDWSGTSTGLMSTPLPTGVRRLPSAADVEALNALQRATTTVDVGHNNATASPDAAAEQPADPGTVGTTGTQETTAWDDDYVWNSWLPASAAAQFAASPFQALHAGCDEPPTEPLTNAGFTQGTDGLVGLDRHGSIAGDGRWRSPRSAAGEF